VCSSDLGAIVWALDATDIHSGWTEVRAVWNRGAHATRERLSEIQAALPFAITKLDFDNGTEPERSGDSQPQAARRASATRQFLNAHFITHFKAQEPKIELSRSRPYRKNDNAHIEQKNHTHVRLLLGDDRFEHYELVEPLNEALRQWSLWNNLYGAQRRLLRKERQPDGKVKRYHEKKASTPCARLLAREDLSQEQRQKLQAMLSSHDPISMRASIEAKLRVLYARRAVLQAEQDDDIEQPTQSAPPQRRPHAGRRACVTFAQSPTAPSTHCTPARHPACGVQCENKPCRALQEPPKRTPSRCPPS
jgi:hypothetical protein